MGDDPKNNLTSAVHFLHWKNIPVNFWRWINFNPREMACRSTGSIIVVNSFMDRLQALRDKVGKPLLISSGYRSPEYNVRVSKTGPAGPHTTGRAVDIVASGDLALTLILAGRGLGFTGIGLLQHGAISGRFLHLDDLPSENSRPRPTVWTYRE